MGEVVRTQSGRIEGRSARVGDVAVNVFRGIPYAAPPVGALRFRPPAPMAPWSGTRAATAFGAGPAQARDAPLSGLVPGMGVAKTDEDCLTLNVWVPQASGPPRAVLVWFPGGSFVIGAASLPVYDGARLAHDGDVIVVSANYRLGALGFCDARPWGGVANCGVRDAIAALEWVRDNIAAFGGDPERVTAFGESAGGGIVLHALASPMAAGLVAGVIVQSGATEYTLTADRAAVVTEMLCAELGIDDPARLDEVAADDVIDAQSRAQGRLLETVGMMPFHPSIDDEVVLDRPAATLATGAAAGVRMLAGTTADEMRLFVPPSDDLTRARVCKRVARYLDVDANRAEAVVTGYEQAIGSATPADVWTTVFSDVEMQLPLRRVLDAHAAHGPTFTYLFTWEAPGLGACHGVDIPFAFGTLDVDSWDGFLGADADAYACSAAMRRAWAAFARDGHPGWPALSAGRYPTMTFGRECLLLEDPLGPRLQRLDQTRP